jgi:hypothetical protein
MSESPGLAVALNKEAAEEIYPLTLTIHFQHQVHHPLCTTPIHFRPGAPLRSYDPRRTLRTTPPRLCLPLVLRRREPKNDFDFRFLACSVAHSLGGSFARLLAKTSSGN